MKADGIEHQRVRAGRHHLHQRQRQAVRAAVADRRVRPLLQQGHVRQGRHRRAAEDHGRADGRRQEADRAQPRRHDQGGRLRPAATSGRSSASGDLANAWDSKWFDSNGKPQLADDPGWASAFMWQRQLIDWYGYDNIIKFFAANTNNEFNPSNAFENGKVAMMFDGEWRTAFIKADKHPPLNYGTAPFPAASDHPEMYGPARVGGTIVGIPKGCEASGPGVAAGEVPRPRTRPTSCRWRTASTTCRRRRLPRRRRS